MSAHLIPPIHDRTVRWLSVEQVAQIWNRSPRQIRRWCEDGTILSLNGKVYRDRNRWWIGVNFADVPDAMASPI